LFSNGKSVVHEKRITCGNGRENLGSILPEGVAIPINLDVLIERILIAPTASDWIKELVEAITHKYGLTKIIKRSSLRENGLW
jgi:hypothetical protein